MSKKTLKNLLFTVTVAVFAVIIVIFVFPENNVIAEASTSASSISEEISAVKNKLSSITTRQKAIEKALAAAKEKKADSLAEKELLEQQVKSLEDEISVLTDYIASLSENEKILNEKIESLQTEYDEYYAKYRIRVRENYERGNVSYLEILLGSGSFSDMLTRMDYVLAVMEYDNSLLDKMESNLEETKQSKEVLEEAINENKSASQRLKEKKASYNSKVSTLENTISSLNSDINTYGANLAEFSRLEREFQAQIDALMDKQLAYMGGEYFIWPLPSSYSTSSKFGNRTYYINGRYVTDYHDAIDIPAPEGTKIVAAGAGKVILAGWVNTGGGYKTVIDHGGNVSTQYCHQSKILVSVGQTVKQGETIGLVGHTGTATGNHLHFNIRINGKSVDPALYVNYRNDFSSVRKIPG